MAQTDIREKIMEFEQQRQTLMNVSMQKQQLQTSVAGLEKTLEELSKTSEKNVFKAVGNVLVQRDTKEVTKELEDLKETQSLRLKTVEKQEKTLVDKLNTLKTQIEADASAGQTMAAPKGGDATLISSKKKAQ